MNILIIGGTRFLGRHLADSALAHGHEVTLFNRGKTNPELFAQVKNIRGDREKDINLISGKFDAVIDTCGYFPRIVGISAKALKEKVVKYVFISSMSVYADASKIGINENDAVGKIEDETVEEITGESYGPLKALCEQVAQNVFGDRALIIRPGLIVGPHDPTDRFTYWPVRIARGGDVLVPDRPNAPTQIIHARDLADFVIHLIEQNASGVFNASSEPLTLENVFETCKQVSGSNANFKWAVLNFMEKHNIAPWSDMPAWVPDIGEDAGFSRMDVSKAINAGLAFSPLADIIRDTLTWAASRPADYEMKAGLNPEREKELLELMKNAQ